MFIMSIVVNISEIKNRTVKNIFLKILKIYISADIQEKLNESLSPL